MIYLRHKDYERLVTMKDTIEAYLQDATGLGDVLIWFDFDPMSGF